VRRIFLRFYLPGLVVFWTAAIAFSPPILWVIPVGLTVSWVGFVMLINARINAARAEHRVEDQ
jgi:hypothetical protein